MARSFSGVQASLTADRRRSYPSSALKQAERLYHPRPSRGSSAAAMTNKKAIRVMSAEGINGFGLPGATLQLAARSLAMWAIATVKRKYEVSVLITMPAAMGLARTIP